MDVVSVQAWLEVEVPLTYILCNFHSLSLSGLGSHQFTTSCPTLFPSDFKGSGMYVS